MKQPHPTRFNLWTWNSGNRGTVASVSTLALCVLLVITAAPLRQSSPLGHRRSRRKGGSRRATRAPVRRPRHQGRVASRCPEPGLH